MNNETTYKATRLTKGQQDLSRSVTASLPECPEDEREENWEGDDATDGYLPDGSVHTLWNQRWAERFCCSPRSTGLSRCLR